MKKRSTFIVIILLFLIGDCFFSTLSNPNIHSYGTHLFRVLTWLSMALWYYDEQKHNFRKTQIVFFVSILLPIISSFSNYLLLYRNSTFIYISVNIMMTLLWIYVFKKLGKISIKKESFSNIAIHVISFIVFPLAYYFLTLYANLNFSFKILTLVFFIVFAYMSTIARFLDIDEQNKKLLMLSIVLLVLISIVNSHHFFLQKNAWAYTVTRTLTVISRCLLIFVVIESSNKLSARYQED